jgi:hypothetical protein
MAGGAALIISGGLWLWHKQRPLDRGNGAAALPELGRET